MFIPTVRSEYLQLHIASQSPTSTDYDLRS
jgi:hypothetical protein